MDTDRVFWIVGWADRHRVCWGPLCGAHADALLEKAKQRGERVTKKEIPRAEGMECLDCKEEAYFREMIPW